MAVKPLPPCQFVVSYTKAGGDERCGQPANGWLSHRYPGSLCYWHRSDGVRDRRFDHHPWDPTPPDLKLKLTIRELIYRMSVVEYEWV